MRLIPCHDRPIDRWPASKTCSNTGKVVSPDIPGYMELIRRPRFRTDLPIKEIWEIGARLWFEYRCYESHDSCDAKLWYHSHQQCIVIDVSFCGYDPGMFDKTRRGREGPKDQITYKCRFDDGFEWDVCEEELHSNRKFFWRPDPPVPLDMGKEIVRQAS